MEQLHEYWNTRQYELQNIFTTSLTGEKRVSTQESMTQINLHHRQTFQTPQDLKIHCPKESISSSVYSPRWTRITPFPNCRQPYKSQVFCSLGDHPFLSFSQLCHHMMVHGFINVSTYKSSCFVAKGVQKSSVPGCCSRAPIPESSKFATSQHNLSITQQPQNPKHFRGWLIV